MALEMERKFLLSSDRWRDLVESSSHITDGLIAATDGRKTRVRISGEIATLTVKSKSVGHVREEFEYPIPLSDAQRMLECCCGDTILTKWRHLVRHEGHFWEIDEYEGLLNGVILAEVEFDLTDQNIPLPDWVGDEVTAEPSYKKINMIRARQQKAN